MATPIHHAPKHSRRTGVVVTRCGGEPILCPFFSKCDGVLFVDPDKGTQEFRANERGSVDEVCGVILQSGVRRLVLGFVSEPATTKLREAGIDVRLGSCACSLDELVESFDELPAAPGARCI